MSEGEETEVFPLTPPEALVLVVTGMGALGGVIWGALQYGILGALFGLPAGAALGFATSYVILTGLFVTVLPSGILWTKGPRGLWAFIRGTRQPPHGPTDTHSHVG